VVYIVRTWRGRYDATRRRAAPRSDFLRGIGASLLGVGVAGCAAPGDDEDDNNGDGDDDEGEAGDGDEENERLARPGKP
jgi:hypothetical protein